MTTATLSRFLVAAMLLTLLVATLAATADAAAPTKTSQAKRAERAVSRALVHRHGVGTRTKVRCLRRGSRYLCGFAAVPRSRTAVYAGRALVTRRSMRVRLGREVCTGGGCKK
jgi:hypothetical protein